MADSAGKKAEVQVVATPAIEKRISVIRERQAMLDEDLADLYGVETRVFGPAGQTEREALSTGLHVPADKAETGL